MRCGIYSPGCAASLLLLAISAAFAQDPALAPADIKATSAMIAKNHLIAFVSLQVDQDKFQKFRYDRYPDVERIVDEEGVTYARLKGKSWRKSDDWGKTGAIVDSDKAGVLDSHVSIVNLAFTTPTSHDPSQGGFVWKSVSQTKDKDFDTFTYVMTREHPNADGVYPTFTFIKYKNDTDGSLLLTDFTAQMHAGSQYIPVEINFQYMYIFPKGSVKVEYATPAEKKDGQ